MSEIDPNFVEACRKVFQTAATSSLEDVRRLVSERGTGTKRRDMLSALDTVPRAFERPLAGIQAAPKALRALFEAPCPSLSPKRLANVRSLTKAAVATYGAPAVPITKRIPLSPAWAALLALAPRVERIPLYRLACFCTAMRIPPSGINRAVLEGFLVALDHEEAIKQPRSVLANSIGVWNRMSRRVKGWPSYTLAMPTTRDYHMIPASEFSPDFLADITKWKNKLLRPNLLSMTDVRRPLRPATVHMHEQTLRRFASILVRHCDVEAKAIRSIADLVTVKNFEAGIEFLLDRFGGETSPYISNTARTLYNAARGYVQAPQADLDTLLIYCRRLEPKKKARQLSEKNRRLLMQFEDPANVGALMDFPWDERDRALELKNPMRRAKGVERALIAALFLRTAIRIQTLRTLELTDFTKVGQKRLLSIDGSKVKNWTA